MLYIGIDLGTSGLKGILADKDGKIIRQASASYPVYYPFDGWSEQNPEDWFKAFMCVFQTLTDGVKNKIGGVSFAGQMHGLVVLDGEDNVIRPCILWNDGRTEKQTAYLNDVIGKEKLSKLTGNIAYAGFTAPKLLWLKENEPQNFKKIAKIMLPKDYLVYRLTGIHSTDYSDASGTLLLDVKNKRWSREMCEICDIDEKWLPRLYESYAEVGKPLPEYGLGNAVVAAGAGDNAAAAVGTGTVNDGDCTISLGTSGTVFIACDAFFADKNNSLHSFAHADGKWHAMGCILSAASANKWWVEEILKADGYDIAVTSRLGENDVLFLPYLTGERSPHNDVNARGAFVNLSARTTREHMCIAVLEGVAFALRDCVECARAQGLAVRRAVLCGGGAKSELWKKIIANVLDAEIIVQESEQGPAYGAAILAMVCAGEIENVAAAPKLSVTKRILPDGETVRKYNEKYEVYRKLYPAIKSCF